jgi:hypothetical protein
MHEPIPLARQAGGSRSHEATILRERKSPMCWKEQTQGPLYFGEVLQAGGACLAEVGVGTKEN